MISVILKLTDIMSALKITALRLLFISRSHIKRPRANIEMPMTVKNW